MPASFLVTPAETAPPALTRWPEDERQYFTSTPARTGSRWVCFAVSAALHMLACVLVPPVSQNLVGPTERELWIREMRVLRTLRIRVPEQLYLASAGPRPRPKVIFQAGGRRKTASIGPSAGVRRRPRARRIELPPLPNAALTEQSLLQPQFPAELLPSGEFHLPEIFFWAPKITVRRETRPFVAPGHERTPTQPRMLDAPPRLELPNASLPIVPAPGLPDALQATTMAAHLSMPIRNSLQDPSQAAAGASADPVPGDPTAVLSVSSKPMPLREFLTVPPGNQVSRALTAANARPGTESASEDGNGNAGAGAEGNPGGAARGAEEPLPDKPPEPPARPAAAASAGAAKAADPAPVPSAADTLRETALRAAEATRIEHPAGGVFDVVVQSGGVDGFPESAGVLSCRPVYSVFLRVGSARDWILQYCTPPTETPDVRVSGAVVTLGTPAKLSAPYPQVTLRPQVRPRAGAYMMLHGSIWADGRFHDLRVLGQNEPWENEMVLPVLDQWTFRPASLGGKTVQVEVLLAIPRE